MTSLDDIFTQARKADIEAVAGTPLFRAGPRLRGECPLCGASKGKKGGGAFSAKIEDRVFYCFGCQAGGDVIDLERLIRGGSRREAAERLAGRPLAATSRPALEPRRVESSGPSSADRVALELWREGTASIAGTLAETYLRGRGISAEIVARCADRLRFHPAAKWGWDSEARAWIRAPAMLAKVVTPEGWPGGVHATYLAADGRGKARLDPAKRMWGPQRSTEGAPGGAWLTPPTARGPLVVGEGIESTLSAAQLQGEICRMVAALSLGALQGGWREITACAHTDGA